MEEEDQTAMPAQLWIEAVSVFKYLMSLTPEDMKNIRFHAGLINGASWKYWYIYPEPRAELALQNLGYFKVIEGVPERYLISEPPSPYMPRPLGINYENKIINENIVRFQQCISWLYYSGALDFVIENEDRQLVLEVGGGIWGFSSRVWPNRRKCNLYHC